MSFKGHHLRFSVELSSKAGHESIVSHIEGELKHLEHVREYLIKRAKVELEYGSALARISSAAARAISDNDKESPIRKVQFEMLFTCIIILLSKISFVLKENARYLHTAVCFGNCCGGLEAVKRGVVVVLALFCASVVEI